MEYKDFKGQVKISEVKECFDDLTNRINSLINKYNESSYVTDINYNNVSPELAPANYTLSVGGLKKILDAYDGCVLGTKVFKVSNNLCITDGLLIRRTGCIHLPSAVIPKQGKYLFYSPSLKQYKYPDSYIYQTTDWTQPSITSNESWGSISANAIWVNNAGTPVGWNSIPSNAPQTKPFNVTSSYGYGALGGTSAQQGIINKYQINIGWAFPQNLLLTNVSFRVGYISIAGTSGYTCTTSIRNSESGQWEQINSIHLGAKDIKDINIPLENQTSVNAIKINIIFDLNMNASFNANVSSLLLQGKIIKKTITGGTESGANDWIQICKLNYNRDVATSNTFEFTAGKVQNYSITSQLKDVYLNTTETVNTTSNPQFVAGTSGSARGSYKATAATLFGIEVTRATQPSKSNSGSYFIFNKLLLPKGIGNPYSYGGNTIDAVDATKTFGVIVNRS